MARLQNETAPEYFVFDTKNGLKSGSPKRGQRNGDRPKMSDFVRFAPILPDFRWGFADLGKQSADFVQFRTDFVRFGVFANQTKSDKISATPLGRPLLGIPDEKTRKKIRKTI